MKRIIRPVPQYYLYNLLFYGVGFTISLMCFIGVIDSSSWVAISVAIFMLLATLVGLFESVYNIQWIEMDKGVLRVRNAIGVVKEMQISEINKAFIRDQFVFHLKGIWKKLPCLVISTRKSLNTCDIQGAYNRPTYPYVVLPHTVEAEQLVRDAYLMATGNELEIK